MRREYYFLIGNKGRSCFLNFYSLAIGKTGYYHKLLHSKEDISKIIDNLEDKVNLYLSLNKLDFRFKNPRKRKNKKKLIF